MQYFPIGADSADDGVKYVGDHRMQVEMLPLDFAGMVVKDWLDQRPAKWPSLASVEK